MKFSVIIPVYNRKELIKNAVESIIQQDYSDWEMIIIDDSSTDGTAEICDEYSHSDDRIKAIHHGSNKGVSAARNTGLKNASGDFILFLDSDDRLLSEAMSCIAETEAKYHPDIICFGITGYIPSPEISNQLYDRKKIREVFLPEHLDVTPKTKYFLQPYTCNKCFKRSLITDNVIKFDENYKTWEDNDFLVKCLDKSSGLVLLPKQLHKIGTGKTNDNLSKHFYPIMVWNFIASYNNNRNYFGKEYDFDNLHASRINFDVIDILLYKLKTSCNPAEFESLIDDLLKNETVCKWVEHIAPKNSHEKKVKKAFTEKNAKKLIAAYDRPQKKSSGKKKLIKRVIKRLLRIKRKS